MEIHNIIAIVSFVVTFACGFLAKKHSWFSCNLIPIQNLLIGTITAIIEYIISKDFSVAIALSGIAAGGTYDIVHNLLKFKNCKEDKNE